MGGVVRRPWRGLALGVVAGAAALGGCAGMVVGIVRGVGVVAACAIGRSPAAGGVGVVEAAAGVEKIEAICPRITSAAAR